MRSFRSSRRTHSFVLCGHEDTQRACTDRERRDIQVKRINIMDMSIEFRLLDCLLVVVVSHLRVTLTQFAVAEWTA